MSASAITSTTTRDAIKVVARFRPPNSLEQREGGRIVVDIDDTGTNVKLTTTSDPPGGFNFDRAFGIQTTQQEIFEYGVRGIVDEVMAGYNGTVFAYGQTGSGKSFTMMVCVTDIRHSPSVPYCCRPCNLFAFRRLHTDELCLLSPPRLFQIT